MREKARSLDGLAALVARFIPGGLFDNPAGKRDRVFTPWVTFCAFLGQVLQRGSSCQDVVRRVQAMYLALGVDAVDDATGGYCQARKRLSVEVLRSAARRLAQWCAQRQSDFDTGDDLKPTSISGFGDDNRDRMFVVASV